jgi:selenide,water dikinase
VLVDLATRDDAAVFQLSEDRAIVATVDFFTPIVDDPRAFGAIAAANAFSDLYAMGARPLLALNLVGWPRNPEMLEILGEVLAGGSEVARRAGALVLGGHSIDDPEPKFGMVAIGEVHPDRVITNRGARPGDKLVLTKPIGTGILSTALKRDAISEAEMAPAMAVMATLNAAAARAVEEIGDGVHAMTDVTGFGLLGHLRHILEGSGVGARISISKVPIFDRVRDLIEAGMVPGGTSRNVESAQEFTEWADDVGESDRILLSDAQTSGGLLIVVANDAADALVQLLERLGTPAAAVIGEVIDSPQRRAQIER